MTKFLNVYNSYIYPIVVTVIVFLFLLGLLIVWSDNLSAQTISQGQYSSGTRTLEVIMGIMGGLMVFVLGSSEAARRQARKEKNDLIQRTIDKVSVLSENIIRVADTVDKLASIVTNLAETVRMDHDSLIKIKAWHEINHPGQEF